MRRRLFLIFILIFTFAVAGCKISGTITKEDESGAGGVIVYLAGEGEDGVGSIMATTETDADGNFTFEGFHHGTLTITPDPDNQEYTFNPDSRTVTVELFANAVVNFKADVKDKEPTPQEPLQPWSTYQGNAAHTGYVPVSLNLVNFFLGWDQKLTESIPLNPVAAGDGEVFVTTDGDYGPHVAMALDSADGTVLWAYDFSNIEGFRDTDSINPPAYANGTVYIQSGVGVNSYLWAFNARSGDYIFNTFYDNQSFRFYAPTIYEGNVYIGGGYGGAYGFNGGTGDQLWYREWDSPYEQWTPAVNEAHVIAYSGYYNPQLTVIQRSAGDTWEAGDVDFTIPDDKFHFDTFSMNLAPVLGSQNNVIVINGGRLISFDLAGEKVGWQIPGDEEADEGDDEEKGGKHFSGQPSVANGFIYTIYKGYLHARNESDGAFVWEWQPPEGESIVTPMIVTDNLIFVSTESATYAVDLESQTEVLICEAGGHLALSDEGVLFIATAEGQLIAIFTD